ncbi:MAG TPA: TrkA family potassium uptake protein [Acidimicrobiales bacterium]|nr:TrkA family potassium uptake protein [Acidimicrobiales bacterium]
MSPRCNHSLQLVWRVGRVHVVVVGCGRVGSSLATGLVDVGHSVAIIDKRPEAFDRLGQAFSGQMIAGIGFDRDRLIEAGIEKADAVAAVTNGDNSNIMIARVARETFGVERVVARIYDPRRAAIYQRLGIPTVATVSWASERVLRHILPELSAVDWVDPSAKVCLIERAVPGSWAGRLVSDLEEAGRARVVAIGRLGVAQIPKPDLVAQEGDVAYVAVAGDAIAEFDERLARGAATGRH